MIIRKPKLDDYDSIINLYKQLYEAEVPYDDNLSKEYLLKDKQKKLIKDRIKSRKKVFLVAETDNMIIGLIDGFMMDNICYLEKEAYLDHLCVDERYRNQKVATELIEAFTKKVKEKGAKYIKLNAFENNIKAVNFYKKNGFTEHSVYYRKSI